MKIHKLFYSLCLLWPFAANAECTLASTEPRCLGPAVFVFAEYTYLQDGVVHFRKDKFTDSTIRFDENALLPWLTTVADNETLKKNLSLIQKQYVDLARRLDILYDERAKLIRDFGKPEYAAPLDEDIRNLSALGARLAKVAKELLPQIEPLLAKLRIQGARQKGLEGLRSYEIQLDKTAGLPAESLEDIVASLEQAVVELEKTINK